MNGAPLVIPRFMEKIPSLKAASFISFFQGVEQAAQKGLISGEMLEKHTSGAEARFDSIGFIPGINPRPTARMSSSAACKTPCSLRLAYGTGLHASRLRARNKARKRGTVLHRPSPTHRAIGIFT